MCFPTKQVLPNVISKDKLYQMSQESLLDRYLCNINFNFNFTSMNIFTRNSGSFNTKINDETIVTANGKPNIAVLDTNDTFIQNIINELIKAKNGIDGCTYEESRRPRSYYSIIPIDDIFE